GAARRAPPRGGARRKDGPVEPGVRADAAAGERMRRALVVAFLVGCQSGTIQGGDGGPGATDGPSGNKADAPAGSTADAPTEPPADAPMQPHADAPPGGSPDAPTGEPTGDPATGPGGGSNLTCGKSFTPNATFYQDIANATLDPESTMIMDALNARGWG